MTMMMQPPSSSHFDSSFDERQASSELDEEPLPVGRLGRERHRERELASQFSSLHGGWQRDEDPRFDLFVEQKRREEDFHNFDQRVQRAYTAAQRQHHTEIWNGFKRQLKRTGEKMTPAILEQVNRSITQRDEWLREVFNGLDADYRSGDGEREHRAAEELRSCLGGRSGELLQPHYERKLEHRFAGPKKQKLLEQEAEDAGDLNSFANTGDPEFDALAAAATGAGPSLSNDEVNRYAALKPSMSAIEDAVATRYGRAGREHWSMLQSEKDAEYVAKLDEAGKIYKQLLEQDGAYNESVEQNKVRTVVRRMSQAQVRFRTAMELEATREQLVEAHEKMKKLRAEEAETRRLARKKLATQLLAEERQKYYGASSSADSTAQEGKREGSGDSAADKEDVDRIAATMRERIRRKIQDETLNRLNTDLAERAASERDEARARKRVFQQMVAQLEHDSERREGERWMMTNSSSPSSNLASRISSASDPQILQALDDTAQLAATMKQEQARRRGADAVDSDETLTKQALWQVLNEDRWEDPFHTVHSARVQATKNYTELLNLAPPAKLRLGKKSDRGMGGNVTGGEEGKMLQDPWIEQKSFGWGLNHHDIHDLDEDGTRQYFPDTHGWHVRDPKTRDIDLRYEKKLGRGLRWTGPTFYKMGIDAKNLAKDRPTVEDPSIARWKGVTVPKP